MQPAVHARTRWNLKVVVTAAAAGLLLFTIQFVEIVDPPRVCRGTIGSHEFVPLNGPHQYALKNAL